MKEEVEDLKQQLKSAASSCDKFINHCLDSGLLSDLREVIESARDDIDAVIIIMSQRYPS